MANIGFAGTDVRYSGGGVLMLDAGLTDQYGNDVIAGTTLVSLYEYQSDGTFATFDFSTNTFKTITVGAETAAMTHRTGNAGATNLGIWTKPLTVLTGFTVGGLYVQIVTNPQAAPLKQRRRFQYGGSEGDDMLFARQLEEADKVIDKTSPPWREIFYLKGTNTVLQIKFLRDVDGNPISNTNTVIGSAKQT